jgi:hypothetical protein
MILTTLQIEPSLISRAAIGADPSNSVIAEIAEDDWMTADNEYLKKKLLNYEGKVAEVVAWCPEIEQIQDEFEDKQPKATEQEQEVIKGRTVQRQALFKAKVRKVGSVNIFRPPLRRLILTRRPTNPRRFARNASTKNRTSSRS